jgi:hypothetical protein
LGVNPQFLRPMALCGLLAALASCISVTPRGVAQEPEPAHNAVLLVSLEDGSMISQEIPVDAEICMKTLDDSATTCLTRAEPIMSADGSRIIGYHMQRTEIDLYPGE